MERKWKTLLVVLILVISVSISTTHSYQYGRNSLLPILKEAKERTQKLEQELQQTQEEIQELEEAKQALEQGLDQWIETNQALNEELQQLQEEKQTLEHKLASTQERIQELKQRLEQTKEQIRALEQELQALKEKPLEISDVKVTNGYLKIHDQNEEDVITIEWETNRPATSKVELYINDNIAGGEYLPELTTGHKITLTLLQPGSTYDFRVNSIDASGNTAISDIYSFSTPWMRIYFALPRNLTEATYSQTLKDLTTNSTILPTGIIAFHDYGNNYEFLYWNKEQSEGITFWEEGIVHEGALNVSFAVIVTREVNNTLLENSDYPYPIPEDELPEEIRLYLQSSDTCQSDDPEIRALAQELSQGLTKEIDVINNTVSWVNENIERGICGETEYEDAVSVLKYRKGVCRHFAWLTCALLRAQGIPVRLVGGLVVDSNDPRGRTNPVGHMWLQVYYPDVGWVNYDSQTTTHGLPNYLEFEVSVPPNVRDELYPYLPFLASYSTRKTENLYTEHRVQWRGLKDNRIEYTFAFIWKVNQEK